MGPGGTRQPQGLALVYAEGWALYAERLAWELGWYEGDPYGDLGRLQAAAFLSEQSGYASKAKDQLGDRFDLKEFHEVVLTNGGMPLEVLERVADDYIAEKKGS